MTDWDADHDRALARHLAQDDPGECDCPRSSCEDCCRPGARHRFTCWARGRSIRELDCTGAGYADLANLNTDDICEECETCDD